MGAFAFNILGPLEIRHEDGTIPVRGGREQAVLALLLLEEDHVVPLARLIDAVWGSDPPKAPEKAVRNTVSALRSRLARTSGSQTLIETSTAGYRMRLDRNQLDAARFADHAASARHLTGTGRAAEAVGEFRAALAQWRGPALTGLGGLVIEAAVARLEEQRLTAWEDCLNLELRLGRHREVTDELRVLVSEHPLREKLAGQLMLALYRAGRQAEALDAYHRLARQLADDLGLDACGEIKRLHEAILRQDPVLNLQAGAEPADSAAAVGNGHPERPAGSPRALRERVAGQPMLALYRSVRQPEAVETGHRQAGTLVKAARITHAASPVQLPDVPGIPVGAAGLARRRAVLVPARKTPDAADDPGTALNRPSGSYLATTAGFVGRGRELSLLQEALGKGMMVLVVGDAGVGKTRFCGEAMARAAAARMVLVRAECLPLAGRLPLLPVVAAMRDLGGLEDGAPFAAALDSAPGFVREELRRLLPQLGTNGEKAADGWDSGWRRERLFSAVAELLTALARHLGSSVGLVIEDVHWADSATLDFLTFLTKAGRDAITVVVTCRGDEAPLAAHVAGWLADMRGRADVAEILLGPLSRAEVAEQVAALTAGAGRQMSPDAVDELYARAEGNSFFTEQLVAVALAAPAGAGLRVPDELPLRLAELLAVRAGRCAGDAQAVLAALSVGGRPLTEEQISAVSGLGSEAVRAALRELARARLLADSIADGVHRPRHALLCEAVAARLLPGERAALHEGAARALAAGGEPSLAAEVAGHWQAAGRLAEELPARITAAQAAEQVYGYDEAAAHWQRAIELCRSQPEVAAAGGISTPRLYIRAIDALFLSGDSMRAGAAAREAYRSFAGHPDPATAATVCHRAAVYWTDEPPARLLRVMEEALRLFDRAPPSAEHAEALLEYAVIFVMTSQRQLQAAGPALKRALTIAEAVGATAMIPRILAVIAYCLFVRGQIEEGFATIERGRVLAAAEQDGPSTVWLAINHSDALLKLARFADAADVARDGFEAARQAGLGAWDSASTLAGNAAEALLAMGRTSDAAALTDPLATMPPGPDHLIAQVNRAEVDLLRGDTDAATRRLRRIRSFPSVVCKIDFDYEAAQRAVEVELWCGRPGAALQDAQRALALFKVPDLTVLCGRLLTAGMRACADLAERARARRDAPGIAAAAASADALTSWLDRMNRAPFTDHRLVATVPAERATWNAERTRLAGSADPDAWGAVARAWQDLGCPHRAGYARWRQSEALLDADRHSAAAADTLRSALACAEGHAPLLAEIRTLAGRARIPLHQPPAADAPQPAEALAPYRLTGRELAVLRLLTAGRTNTQIGAELAMSPKTASVHVTSILRKLEVSTRVQAAALAERAGLLQPRDPKDGGSTAGPKEF